jgi:TolA-binding protein
LLLAGMYNQSREDRKAKRFDDAAALVTEMRRRYPNDTTIRFLGVESLMDRKNYRGALAATDSMAFAPNDARNTPRKATVRADAYLALGKPDSARAALAQVVAAFPQNTRLKAKLDSIK